ncbi:hypothetical protein GQ457_06G008840 [Hibiscus cannabinus]
MSTGSRAGMFFSSLGGSDPRPHRPPSGGVGPRSRGGLRKATMRQRCGPVVPMWCPAVSTRCSERWAMAVNHFSDEGVCYIFESPRLGAMEPSIYGWNQDLRGGLNTLMRLSDWWATVVGQFSGEGVSYILESPHLGATELSSKGWNRDPWGGLKALVWMPIRSITAISTGHGCLYFEREISEKVMTLRAGKFEEMLICRPWTTTSARWCRPKLGSKAECWGCSASITVFRFCGSEGDHGCTVYCPDLGKYRILRDIGCSTNLGEGKLIKWCTLGCSHVMRHEIEPQDPFLGYGKMFDGACLGGEDSRPLIDFLEPPLGYNKSCNGADWICGCSAFFTESGSYKTDQDGCFSVDLLGLDKCGFYRGRGSCMVLTISGRFCWWPHSCPLTGPLIGLEASPRIFKRKGGMHGYICGCSMAPSRTDSLGESRTPRCRSKSSHARELGYVLSSIVQPLGLGYGARLSWLGRGVWEGCYRIGK